MTPEQVLVHGGFDSAEAVEAFFRRLAAAGRIVSLSGDLDFQGNPRGAPELRQAADGFLFPRKATVVYERDGDTFRLHFDRMARDTTVRIQGPGARLREMEEWLHSPPRASVFLRGLNAGTVARIYERLQPEPLEDYRLRVDGQGRFVPEKLKAQTVHGLLEFFSHGKEYDLILHGREPAQAARVLRDLVAEARPAKPQTLEGEVEVRGYTWDRVGGLGEVVQQLRDWVELPLRNPAAFQQLGLRPPKGVLLSGPPGTGKTTLARVLACESRAAFFTFSPGDTASMWYGETERNLRKLFGRAREHPRAILFVDEIDGFFASRDQEVSARVLSQLMTEMDGLSRDQGVIVLGATNRPDRLDAALRRPGRFDHQIELGLPDEAGREAILRIHLGGKPAAGLDVRALAARSEGKSGAELEGWCNEATYRAWRRTAAACGKDPAEMQHELAQVKLLASDFPA